MYGNYNSGKNIKDFILKNVLIAGMVCLFSTVIVGYFAALSARMKNFTVNRTFYFLSVKAAAETAAVLAQSEYTDGGAGYTFQYGGEYYVGLAAYNTEREARLVQDTLKNRGRDTQIVSLTVDTFYFTDRKEIEAYENTHGFVTTVLQCVDLLYAAANGLDEGAFTQSEARGVLKEISGVISRAGEGGVADVAALSRAGVEKCAEITDGVIYAKDVRYLQLQLSEGVYNLQKVFAL